MPANFLIRPNLSPGGGPDTVPESVVRQAPEVLLWTDRIIRPVLLFPLPGAWRETD